MITLNFNNDEKLYIQIYNYFVNEIKSGNLKSNDKLPSRRLFAQNLGVSLNTVKNAYEQLLDEGYIVSRERSGFFVDKLSIENLNIADHLGYEVIENKQIVYEYNFNYSLLEKSLLPESILKKCSAFAVEKCMGNEKISKLGLMSLRNEISKYLHQRRAVCVSPEDIIIASGYFEHLFLIMSIIKNSYFAMEDPGYNRTWDIFKSFSRNIIHVPIDKYGFSVKDLEKTAANIVITTPNHQFPTGIIMGIRRRQRLLNWANEQAGRYIIEDDYNGDFRYLGNPIPALKSLDTKGKVILSGSFSQSIGNFLGVSYLVLPTNLRKELESKQILLSGTSKLQQYFLEYFLKTGSFEKHINRMNTHYRKKRAAVLKILKTYEGIEILGSQSGLHIILRLDKKNFDLTDFDEKMLENKIYIKRVKDFSIAKWQDNDLILGFGGIPIENIDTSIKQLLKILKK